MSTLLPLPQPLRNKTSSNQRIYLSTKPYFQHINLVKIASYNIKFHATKSVTSRDNAWA